MRDYETYLIECDPLNLDGRGNDPMIAAEHRADSAETRRTQRIASALAQIIELKSFLVRRDVDAIRRFGCAGEHHAIKRMDIDVPAATDALDAGELDKAERLIRETSARRAFVDEALNADVE